MTKLGFQARKCVSRAPAVSWRVLLKVAIFSASPEPHGKITSHGLRVKAGKNGEDTQVMGTFLTEECSLFRYTCDSLDKGPAKLSSAHTTTTTGCPAQTSETKGHISQGLPLLKPHQAVVPYREWRPVKSKSQISSNIILCSKSLKEPLKKKSTHRHTPPQRVALLLRTEKSVRGQECCSRTSFADSFLSLPSALKLHPLAWLQRYESCYIYLLQPRKPRKYVPFWQFPWIISSQNSSLGINGFINGASKQQIPVSPTTGAW